MPSSLPMGIRPVPICPDLSGRWQTERVSPPAAVSRAPISLDWVYDNTRLSRCSDAWTTARGNNGARINEGRAMGPNKLNTKTIDLEMLDVYVEARYILTTIEPADNGPVMNTYLVDQEGLNAFFRAYGEHGEFVVELKRVRP